MNRLVLCTALLLALPTGVFAQLKTSGGTTASELRAAPKPAPTPPKPTPATPTRTSYSGWSYDYDDDTENPYDVYRRNYYTRSAPSPAPFVVELGAPIPVFRDPAQAMLSIEFPAAAEVWQNGKKIAGLSREWLLTSPTIEGDTAYLFDVRARWKVGGKTYETERSVPVFSGSRSRALVVGGRMIQE